LIFAATAACLLLAAVEAPAVAARAGLSLNPAVGPTPAQPSHEERSDEGRVVRILATANYRLEHEEGRIPTPRARRSGAETLPRVVTGCERDASEDARREEESDE
jgi:hypothetical protein